MRHFSNSKNLYYKTEKYHLFDLMRFQYRIKKNRDRWTYNHWEAGVFSYRTAVNQLSKNNIDGFRIIMVPASNENILEALASTIEKFDSHPPTGCPTTDYHNLDYVIYDLREEKYLQTWIRMDNEDWVPRLTEIEQDASVFNFPDANNECVAQMEDEEFYGFSYTVVKKHIPWMPIPVRYRETTRMFMKLQDLI